MFLIKHIFLREGEVVEKVSLEREKYSSLEHLLNKMNEWYALNRQKCRNYLQL